MYNVYKHILDSQHEYIDLPYEHKILRATEEKGKIVLHILGETDDGTVGAYIKCIPNNQTGWNKLIDEFYIDTVYMNPFSWIVTVEYINNAFEPIRNSAETQLINTINSFDQRIQHVNQMLHEIGNRLNSIEKEPYIQILSTLCDSLSANMTETTNLLDERFFAYMESMTAMSLVTMVCSPTGMFDLLHKLNKKVTDE